MSVSNIESLPGKGCRRYEMADLKYKPVPHDHEASKRKAFRESYEALEEECQLIREILAARSKFGVGQ